MLINPQPDLPPTNGAELQLRLLYERLTLLNNLIEHMEAYQTASAILPYVVALDPPVPPTFVNEAVWQTLTLPTHRP